VKEVLPALQSYLKEVVKTSGAVVIRVSVALVMVKVFKLLPSHFADVHLPRLITEIVAQLKSRTQLTRDQTRSALNAVAVTLGAPYFRFILQELSDALRRGFEVHVLGFTLHSLLHHLIEGAHVAVGSLDYCLAPLLRLLLHDIFGTVAEQKEVEKIQHAYKEAKRIQSFRSFELLAKCIDFEQSVLFLLRPVKEILLESAVDHSQLTKVDKVLRHICLGLTRNPSVKQHTLCMFVHQLIRTYLSTSSSSVSTSATRISSSSHTSPVDLSTAPPLSGQVHRHLLEPSPRERALQKPPTSPQQHLLVVFGLQLLFVFLKNPSMFQPATSSISSSSSSSSSPSSTTITSATPTSSSPTVPELVDPFIPLLVECSRSPFDRVVALALKVRETSLPSFLSFSLSLLHNN
jgi:hypothetical protein